MMLYGLKREGEISALSNTYCNLYNDEINFCKSENANDLIYNSSKFFSFLGFKFITLESILIQHKKKNIKISYRDIYLIKKKMYSEKAKKNYILLTSKIEDFILRILRKR